MIDVLAINPLLPNPSSLIAAALALAFSTIERKWSLIRLLRYFEVNVTPRYYLVRTKSSIVSSDVNFTWVEAPISSITWYLELLKAILFFLALLLYIFSINCSFNGLSEISTLFLAKPRATIRIVPIEAPRFEWLKTYRRSVTNKLKMIGPNLLPCNTSFILQKQPIFTEKRSETYLWNLDIW